MKPHFQGQNGVNPLFATLSRALDKRVILESGQNMAWGYPEDAAETTNKQPNIKLAQLA